MRPGPSAAQRERLSREEMEAHQNADRIVHLALTRSEAILAASRLEAEEVGRKAARQAEEAEQARQDFMDRDRVENPNRQYHLVDGSE